VTIDTHTLTSRGSGRSPGSAKRAVARWGWRLFLKEWRQQVLVLALIVMAVGATFIGSTVAKDTPPVASAGLGTAEDAATYQGTSSYLASKIAALQPLGPLDVIENETLTVPGTLNTFDLRSQNPHGPYGAPMLTLLSGNYAVTNTQVAVTPGVATDFNLHIGSTWHENGVNYRVVGIVENPQNLLDEFALVKVGQLTSSGVATVLFDAGTDKLGKLASSVRTVSSSSNSNQFNPETISIALSTIGMLLIALVAVAGFTVLAQRRLRSLGMLASLGATERNVRLVVVANGLAVGIVGTFSGVLLGFLGWLVYRPHLESSAHHAIAVLDIPWTVVVVSVVLGIAATLFAAWRPARAVSRIPIVAALAGRPAPPKQIRRTAVPGIVCFVGSFVLLGFSSVGNSAQPTPFLLVGLVMLVPGVILLAPFLLTFMERLGGRAPVSVRLALRDLSRYRARSSSALSAISLGVMIAVIVSLATAARFGNVLDYAGPNMNSNQIIVYTPYGPYYSPPGFGPTVTAHQLSAMKLSATRIANELGSHHVVELLSTSASLNHNATGRNFSGPVFIATPSLLKAFHINASQVNSRAAVLTMRPGLSTVTKMQLTYGSGCQVATRVTPGHSPKKVRASKGCAPTPGGSVNKPVIQQVSGLPSGTSTPNTIITEYEVNKLHLPTQVEGWLIQLPHPPTAAQISATRLAAANANMRLETKSSIPSSQEIIDWATFFALALSLVMLALSVGLIRSETSADLRTLSATGASNRTRRNITAATAGALGFAGGLLGILAGYVGIGGWIRGSALNGGLGALSSVPIGNLLVILFGMPLLAAAVAWMFSGRQPKTMNRQPLE
jgi:putative ABC transport system permease protein